MPGLIDAECWVSCINRALADAWRAACGHVVGPPDSRAPAVTGRWLITEIYEGLKPLLEPAGGTVGKIVRS